MITILVYCDNHSCILLHTNIQTRVHYLELLYRIVDTTNYTDHKHRHHELVTCLNRIAQEEDAEGTPDYELVRKIWKTYPGVFEEITDL